jgi:hypothetical protein
MEQIASVQQLHQNNMLNKWKRGHQMDGDSCGGVFLVQPSPSAHHLL